MLSIPHLIVIFVVALVVFGPEKLPELARNFGKVMAEFRRATGDLRTTFEGHMRDLERESETRRIAPPGGPAAQAPAQAPATPASPTGPQPVPSAAPRAVPAPTSDLPPGQADAAAVEAGVVDPMQDPFLAGYDFDVPRNPEAPPEPPESSAAAKPSEPDEKSPEKVSQK
ncbi:MAG TPA: twin-arginine translocase TatA/TatE family subunit [Candidatus Acidoferrales bacterium]|jgi:TatA/E family protein of Tat protein translocase|nr:twin-arginine translocase TatA/TatE family subunit [Candidatus Acidoferrales bacterium]